MAAGTPDRQARYGLDLTEHRAEAHGLTALGLQPVRISGYLHDGTPRYTSLWAATTGGTRRIRCGLTAAAFGAALRELARSGFRPVDVSACGTPGGPLFSAVWEQEDGPEWTARHGLRTAEYRLLADRLTRAGHRLRCLAPYEDADGERFVCVWDRTAGPDWTVRHGLSPEALRHADAALAADGFRLVRSLGHPLGRHARCTGIWERSPGRPYTAEHGVPLPEHLRHAARHAAAGRRLVDLGGFAVGGTELCTAVWESGPPDGPEDPVTALVEPFRRTWSVPGLSLAVADRGEVLTARAFGHANPATRESATPGHRFRLASVSKPITSAAVHLLADHARLTLTERVFGDGALLGTRYGRRPYGARLRALRVQHLLEHTSGGWTNDADDPMFGRLSLGLDALVSRTLDHHPLRAFPGTVHGYSNFGYCLLGRIVERVSGLTYGEFVRRHLLVPAGAGQAVLAGATAADRQDPEAVYLGTGPHAPYRIRVDRMDAAGGWAAAPADVLRLLAALDGTAARPALLRPETFAAMTTASARRPATATSGGYARGWAVNTAGTIWHTGAMAGTQSVLVRRADGRAWCAVCNTGRPDDTLGEGLDELMWEVQAVVGG
ncbi:serine hydrolase [Kitasatospora sp. DSM 101779]|uniref:serine hydrolase n=1 Tax=Kitasatospora sp. DSM 101779 TaxID=2853165 RepID=UPI0021DB4A6C|nr:serine hydrolase [Kitasatospora sp. DSM 101779]MCU7820689.1 serine hydrolase [Kitasatospora sp. DSM 101779]